MVAPNIVIDSGNTVCNKGTNCVAMSAIIESKEVITPPKSPLSAALNNPFQALVNPTTETVALFTTSTSVFISNAFCSGEIGF